MNKKIGFLILLAGLFALPLFVSAATIATMAQAIAGQVVAVGTWIVVIMWVVSGIMFLMAAGDPGTLKNAKTGLFAAIGGTIIIFLAVSAISDSLLASVAVTCAPRSAQKSAVAMPVRASPTTSTFLPASSITGFTRYLNLRVVSENNAKTSARIQNRTIVFDSLHPPNSK